MKDRFSNHSKEYATFRPGYPKGLYDFIFNHVNYFNCAWDAGTGNGQVAADLASRFRRVLATDISVRQLDQARRLTNIDYSVAGEVTVFPNRTTDLITVGQAIHWFDRDNFYKEVKRVAKPGSLVAVWGYGLLSISPEIDPLLEHFYREVVGPYWDPERKLIDERYQTISFPFDEIKTPAFRFSVQWSLKELQGYLETWSSVRKYMQINNTNPVDDFVGLIRSSWSNEKVAANFPLFLRLGRVNN